MQTRIGTLEFKDGAPSAATVRRVYDSLDFVRDVDAFMNGFSGASAYAIRESFRSIGADYFGPSKPADAKAGNRIQTIPGKGWFEPCLVAAKRAIRPPPA